MGPSSFVRECIAGNPSQPRVFHLLSTHHAYQLLDSFLVWRDSLLDSNTHGEGGRSLHKNPIHTLLSQALSYIRSAEPFPQRYYHRLTSRSCSTQNASTHRKACSPRFPASISRPMSHILAHTHVPNQADDASLPGPEKDWSGGLRCIDGHPRYRLSPERGRRNANLAIDR